LPKKSASEMRIRPRSLYYEGLPSPRRQPRLVNRNASVRASHNFRAFSFVHRATAAIPISPQQTENKVLQSLTTEVSPQVEATPWFNRQGQAHTVSTAVCSTK